MKIRITETYTVEVQRLQLLLRLFYWRGSFLSPTPSLLALKEQALDYEAKVSIVDE